MPQATGSGRMGKQGPGGGALNSTQNASVARAKAARVKGFALGERWPILVI